MLYTMVVHESLKKSLNPNIHGYDQDSLISLLIHDIFGGEILKTRNKGGWHFYNRVDGLRLDFSRSEMDKPMKAKKFEDIPASPDETYSYFEKDQYSFFLSKFIRSFEESFSLDKYKSCYTS